ncbi:hypothetical protein H6F93_20320 [Leptolyngbya sp. FACHB-671]|nr:hypothetical protein [Leptolyngbya sp. FACHB-671]
MRAGIFWNNPMFNLATVREWGEGMAIAIPHPHISNPQNASQESEDAPT